MPLHWISWFKMYFVFYVKWNILWAISFRNADYWSAKYGLNKKELVNPIKNGICILRILDGFNFSKITTTSN